MSKDDYRSTVTLEIYERDLKYREHIMRKEGFENLILIGNTKETRGRVKQK